MAWGNAADLGSESYGHREEGKKLGPEQSTVLGSGSPLCEAYWPESPPVTSWVFQGCLVACPVPPV